MLTFSSFSGINNVLPSERLTPDRNGVAALTKALNVDFGLTGEIRRRDGYAQASELCHKNLWQGEGFLLATCNDALTAIRPDTTRTVLHPALGSSRVWYCNLPDGRTAFTNGAIMGLTDGATATEWGVPIPPSAGVPMEINGALFPGDYQYSITYVRLSTGLESGPRYAAPLRIEDGGLFISGLPELAGHKINVYLSGHDGAGAFLAGSTTNGLFSYIGKNDALVMPCRTEQMQPPPTGKMPAFWRGRTLVAQGSVLYASVTNQWETFDLRRDFKQFTADITCVVPVDDGIYVGTTENLVFLGGVQWDQLTYREVVSGPVVLGSGVSVRGELLKQGEGAGLGAAMVCIADGVLVAGFNGGGVLRMSEGQYRTSVDEVWATFRMVDGVPQYLAVAQ